MKINRVIIFGSFIFLYLVLVVIMFIKTDFHSSIFQHTFLVLVSMVCLLWLINKTRGGFFKVFAIVSMVYYIVACFSSVIISLIRNNYSAFENMGVLARTEGFLAFTLMSFILLIWLKPELLNETE